MKKEILIIPVISASLLIIDCSRKKSIPVWAVLIAAAEMQAPAKKDKVQEKPPVTEPVPTNPSGTEQSAAPENQAEQTYSLAGNLTGLRTGEKLIIKDGQEEFELNSNGTFVFPGQRNSGTSYSVTVVQNPMNQSCAVNNGSGVIASASINDVNIICSNDYLLVQSVNPAKNSLNNPVNPVIQFQMNKDLDCGKNAEINLVCGGSNIKVNSACSGKSLTVTPNTALPYFQLCTVNLNAAFAENSTLESAYSYSFKTTDKMPYIGIVSLEYPVYTPPAFISSTLNPQAGVYLAAVKNGDSAYYFFREAGQPYALKGVDYTEGRVTTTTTVLFSDTGLDPLKKIDIYVKNSSSVMYSCYSGGAVQFLDPAQNVIQSIALSPCRGIGIMTGYDIPAGTFFIRLVSSDWGTAVRIVNQINM